MVEVKTKNNEKRAVDPLEPLAGTLMNEYRQSLEALNRSSKTISWYMGILRQFFDFLKSHDLVKSIDELGRKDLRAYVRHLQNAQRWPNRKSVKYTGKLSPFSVQGHVRAIRAFWSWLEDEGHIDHDPLSGFPLPKVPQRVIRVLDEGQIDALLKQLDRKSPQGARDYLILVMLLGMGLRVSELVSIKIEDIDFNSQEVRVLGKGQKERVVNMHPLISREITKYLRVFRQQLCRAASAYLFPSKDGGPLNINCVQQSMRRLAKKAGLDGVKMTPHICRHTFATMCIANGMDISVLMPIMGHNSIQTTLKYTHLKSSDIKNQYARFSPLGNLKIR